MGETRLPDKSNCLQGTRGTCPVIPTYQELATCRRQIGSEDKFQIADHPEISSARIISQINEFAIRFLPGQKQHFLL
jgi:hypothetical protein